MMNNHWFFIVAAIGAFAGLLACAYYASKELSKLTADIMRAWTDD